MECKCGGSTKEHKVKAGTFVQCTACGRVSWIKRIGMELDKLDVFATADRTQQ